jgi:hypothetical protein
LLAVLRNNENLLYIEIIIKKGNIFSKKKRGMLSFESISSPYYKVYDFEGIKKINDSNDLRKKDIITNL